MKNWSRLPVFRLFLPFAAGIFKGLQPGDVPVYLFYVLAIAFAGAIWSAFALKKLNAYNRYFSGAALLVTAFCAGWLIANWSHRPYEQVADTDQTFIGIITDYPQLKSSGLKATVDIVRNINDSVDLRTTQKILLQIANADSGFLSPGDLIVFSGVGKTVNGALLPGLFDYKRYLHFKGIHTILKCRLDEVVILEKKYAVPLQHKLSAAREKLFKQLQQTLKQPEVIAVAAALILGDDRWMDDTTATGYRNSGVLHVLCVSGMHVVLLLTVIEKLLGMLKIHARYARWKIPLLIVCTWSYTSLTGFAPSITRAAMMMTVGLAGKWFNRKTDALNLIGGSCLLILLFSPHFLMEVGFQLSLFAVIGIRFFHERISGLWQPENKVVYYIWQLAAVSLAAQLATTPLSVYYFHQFPNYFLFANLLVVPLGTMILYCGLLLAVLLQLPLPPLWSWCGKLIAWLIETLNAITGCISQLPHAVTADIYISSIILFLIFIFTCCFMVWPLKQTALRLFSLILLLIGIGGVAIYHDCQISQQSFTICLRTGKSNTLVVTNGRTAKVIAAPGVSNYYYNQLQVYLKMQGVAAIQYDTTCKKGWVEWSEAGEELVMPLGYVPEAATSQIAANKTLVYHRQVTGMSGTQVLLINHPRIVALR